MGIKKQMRNSVELALYTCLELVKEQGMCPETKRGLLCLFHRIEKVLDIPDYGDREVAALHKLREELATPTLDDL